MKTNLANNGAHANSRNKVRWITQAGMLGAISVVLMLFEIPLPFAPSFYQLDFSEVPVLVGCFAMGPAAGAVIELVKIALNFVINGTKTGGIGEIANLIIGCALCVPAGIIYHKLHNRQGAFAGLMAGTITMTIVGSLINAFLLLPVYAQIMGFPLEGLIEMGTKVNGAITDLNSFVLFAVAPFNLLKGVLVSLIVLIIYKKISPVLKMNR